MSIRARAGNRAWYTRPEVRTGAAIITLAALVLTTGQGVRETSAAWTDAEFTHAGATTASSWCLDGMYESAASATLLAGTAAGADPGSIVRWHGIQVHNDGTATDVLPPGTPAVDEYTYADPLVVGLVGDLVTTDLSGAVSLPAAGAEAGLLGQWGRADPAGRSTGAAGAIGSDGAIDVGLTGPSQPAPTLATVDLRGLLGGLLGDSAGAGPVSTLGDVRLDLGALAARGDLDGCPERGAAVALREYAVAGLSLLTESTTIAALGTTATSSTAALQAALEGADPLGPALTDSLMSVVNGLLGGLGTAVLGGTPQLTVDVDVDLTAVVAPLIGPLGSGEAVEIDLTGGAVRVDIARLVDEVDGLNGLPANTEVLTGEVLGPAVTHTGSLLTAWVTQLTNAVTQSLSGAHLTVGLQIPLSLLSTGVSLGTLVVETSTSLDVLSGDTTAAVRLVGCPVLTALVCGLITGILGTIQLSVVSTVTDVVTSTVFGPGGLLPTLTGSLSTGVSSVLGVLGPVFQALTSLVSVQVNAQPDQPRARVPAVSTGTGQYAVSAVRIGVLDAATATAMALATATVGPNVYRYR